MTNKPIVDRLRVTPWSWWVMWLLSVLLLALLVMKHPAAELRELAEHFRPIHLLLPVHIVVHRGLGTLTSYVLGIGLFLGLISILRPQEGKVLLPLAVGLALLFFAYHTFFYSHMMTEWMRANAPSC